MNIIAAAHVIQVTHVALTIFVVGVGFRRYPNTPTTRSSAPPEEKMSTPQVPATSCS